MDFFIPECTAMDTTSEMEHRLYCGPSEDIWEKFGFLPTPPRSPNRTCSDDEDCETTSKLTLISDLLDNPEFAIWGGHTTWAVGLKNDLLHDCMWSGQCTDTCKRGHGHQQHELTAVQSEGEKSIVGPSPALVVDPCTMLPYTPLSDHSYHNQYQTTASQPRTPPLCETPSDTEDEIDVVSVPAAASLTSLKSETADVASVHLKRTSTAPKRRPGRPPTVPPLRVVIRTSNLVSKHKERRNRHSRKRFQKRVSSAPSKSSSGGWTRRHYKRHFTPHKYGNRTESCSSDSEDCIEKRTMHNSMERKRRDDLRYAFQNLKQHVPDLAANPKAPKVLILNRAASYARQLSQTSAALEKTLKQETRRKHELQKKLLQLSKLK